MLIGIYHKSSIVTYTGVVLAVLGMVFAMQAQIKFSMIFLMLAGICDLFDGKFAGFFQRTVEEKAFGVQIDSLADMISFVALPIVLANYLGPNNGIFVVFYGFYALAGITRLGYFNIQDERKSDKPIQYYQGLPVTYAALIFPVVWVLSGWIQPGIFKVIYGLCMLLVGILFISPLQIKKPKGKAYVFFICLAIGIIAWMLVMG